MLLRVINRPNVVARLSELFHLALRSATLVLRFALTFYIVRFLGYEASGIYGLAAGAVGIVPALIGWGLNYFAAREVIGSEPKPAAILIKSRLLITAVSLVMFALAAIGIAAMLAIPFDRYYGLILIIIVFETFALDLHMPMLALDMGRQANILVFVRSALWVPAMIATGLLFPSLNCLTSVFAFWIASHILSIGVLVFFLRDWPLGEVATAPIRRDWLSQRLRQSWYIYLSDVSLVGMLYADRYIVSYMLGLTITGIYTFYWSLTNALQTLITTAVVQVLFPIVYKSYSPENVGPFIHTLKTNTARVAVLSAVLGALVYVFGEVAIRFLPDKAIAEYRWIFVLLIGAAVVRTCSEMLNIGLTTLKQDSLYASLNIMGAILSLSSAFVMILLFGFIGVGLAALTTAIALAAVRGRVLWSLTARARCSAQTPVERPRR